MDGSGTRMGSRSSTRHGPAAVFNGPVRRWRKTWQPVPATSMSLASSPMQQYRWMAQAPREDISGDAPALRVKYLPLSVVVERRKEAIVTVVDAPKKDDLEGERGLNLHDAGTNIEQSLEIKDTSTKDLRRFGQRQTLSQGDSDMFSEESDESE